MDEETTEQVETVKEEPHGTDWKAEARKWEERSKANLRASEEAIAKAKEAEAAAADAKGAMERAARLEKELAELKAASERDAEVRRVARERGVDEGVLARMSGDVSENADLLRAVTPTYRDVGQGGTAAPSGVTRESILAIGNDRERLGAIQENIELFN